MRESNAASVDPPSSCQRKRSADSPVYPAVSVSGTNLHTRVAAFYFPGIVSPIHPTRRWRIVHIRHCEWARLGPLEATVVEDHVDNAIRTAAAQWQPGPWSWRSLERRRRGQRRADAR